VSSTTENLTRPTVRGASTGGGTAGAPGTMAVVIPVKNGGERFRVCLPGWLGQAGVGEVLVIDSGSTDGSDAFAEAAGATVVRIEPAAFHHARTRMYGVFLTRAPFVLMTVQDARPMDRFVAENLRASIDRPVAGVENRAVAAYARHVPEPGHSLQARLRVWLDPAGSHEPRWHGRGAHAPALNNVAALYRREALRQTPFPEVPFAEDAAWARAVCAAGAYIRFEPAAVVEHSHERPPADSFWRAYADGSFHARAVHRPGSALEGLADWASLLPRTALHITGDTLAALRLADGAGTNLDPAARARDWAGLVTHALATQAGFTLARWDAATGHPNRNP